MSTVQEESRFSLAGGTFTLRRDGILVGVPTAKDLDLADAKEFERLWIRISPNQKLRVLLDQRGVNRKMSTEARDFLAQATARRVERIAVLVSNTFSRFFASGLLAATGLGKTLSARAFDTEAAAIAWLREGIHTDVTPPPRA